MKAKKKRRNPLAAKLAATERALEIASRELALLAPIVEAFDVLAKRAAEHFGDHVADNVMIECRGDRIRW